MGFTSTIYGIDIIDFSTKLPNSGISITIKSKLLLTILFIYTSPQFKHICIW